MAASPPMPSPPARAPRPRQEGGLALAALVAAALLVCTLALGGALAVDALTAAWVRDDAALSVQVPEPEALLAGQSRRDRALALLRASAEVATARVLTPDQVAALLRPWIGADAASLDSFLPAVIAVRLAPGADASALATRLAAAVPGTRTSGDGPGQRRLATLAAALRRGGRIGFALAALLAAGIIAVATHASIAGRRPEVILCHHLGGSDRGIAGRVATKSALLTLAGGSGGTLAALALLAVALTATGATDAARATIAPSWLAFALLPPGGAAVSFLTAGLTARRWLRALP
jgi:cell division transport system permease protein